MPFPPIQTMSSWTRTGRAEFSNQKIEDRVYLKSRESLPKDSLCTNPGEIKNIYLTFRSLNVSRSESEIRERFYRAR